MGFPSLPFSSKRLQNRRKLKRKFDPPTSKNNGPTPTDRTKAKQIEQREECIARSEQIRQGERRHERESGWIGENNEVKVIERWVHSSQSQENLLLLLLLGLC